MTLQQQLIEAWDTVHSTAIILGMYSGSPNAIVPYLVATERAIVDARLELDRMAQELREEHEELVSVRAEAYRLSRAWSREDGEL